MTPNEQAASTYADGIQAEDIDRLKREKIEWDVKDDWPASEDLLEMSREF